MVSERVKAGRMGFSSCEDHSLRTSWRRVAGFGLHCRQATPSVSQSYTSMSTTADLVNVLKKELKSAQMTYADLAQGLGMAESSVKRMLAKGDMALSRIDAI